MEPHPIVCALNADDPPVTYSVSWRVKPGSQAAYAQVLEGMVHAAMAFPGHLGATVYAPQSTAEPVFHIIVRFDSFTHLKAWTNSEERSRWLRKAEQYQAAPPALKVLTGLEAWFSAPNQAAVLCRHHD